MRPPLSQDMAQLWPALAVPEKGFLGGPGWGWEAEREWEAPSAPRRFAKPLFAEGPASSSPLKCGHSCGFLISPQDLGCPPWGELRAVCASWF